MHVLCITLRAPAAVQNAPGVLSNGGVLFKLQRPDTKKPRSLSEVFLYGAPGEIRTPDQVVRSHLLYPAELRVRSERLLITLRRYPDFRSGPIIAM